MQNEFFGVDPAQDPEIEKQIKEEIASIDKKSEALIKRVESMDLIHEDLIVIEKIDVRAIKSFLEFVQKSEFDRMRTSYYGRVLKVSQVDDDVEGTKNLKKKLLKPGDIISFNPDAAYSLNVIVPDEMPELWVLSIENVLLVDRGFDPAAAKRKTIEANVIVRKMQEKARKDGMEKAHRMLIEEGRKAGKIM